MSSFYNNRGVSPSKEDVHSAISVLPSTDYPGAFCQAVLSSDGMIDIIHSDGAGTKSTVAYLEYRETGDPSCFSDIAIDSAVMNIDDLVCVGACDNFLLSNTIGRNAHRIPGDVIANIIKGYSDFSKHLSSFGVSIRLCGGETADLGDLVKTVIVDSTIFCKIKKSEFVDTSKIKPNQKIVGLSSHGKATYESRQNSGIGSNGFTVARHVLLHNEYAIKYPETFSDTLDPKLSYAGSFKLDDGVPGCNLSISESLLSPTRTYAPIMKEVLTHYKDEISGVLHCSGGGQTKCLNFGSSIRYIKDSFPDFPPIFKLIQKEGSIPDTEMWQIFNNGIRLEIICDESVAENIVDTARKYNVDAYVIGRTEVASSDTNELIISHRGEESRYSAKT